MGHVASYLARNGVATAIGIVGGAAGGYLLKEALEPTRGGRSFLWLMVIGVVLFWAVALIVKTLVGYKPGKEEPSEDEVGIREWGVVRFLRNGIAAAPLFLGFRLFYAYEWWEAGRHKIEDEAWTESGLALKSYWERVVAVPEPPARPSIAYQSYRDFIQYMLDNEWYEWFGFIIAWGEVAVAVAVFLGAFTAYAVAGGMMMNFAFVYAGSASTNPTLIILGVILLFCWRTCGLVGLDAWLIPLQRRIASGLLGREEELPNPAAMRRFTQR